MWWTRLNGDEYYRFVMHFWLGSRPAHIRRGRLSLHSWVMKLQDWCSQCVGISPLAVAFSKFKKKIIKLLQIVCCSWMLLKQRGKSVCVCSTLACPAPPTSFFFSLSSSQTDKKKYTLIHDKMGLQIYISSALNIPGKVKSMCEKHMMWSWEK